MYDIGYHTLIIAILTRFTVIIQTYPRLFNNKYNLFLHYSSISIDIQAG